MDLTVELVKIVGDLADLRIKEIVEAAVVEKPSPETQNLTAREEKPSIFASTATTEDKATGILLVAVATIFALIALIVELRSRKTQKKAISRVKVRRKALKQRTKKRTH